MTPVILVVDDEPDLIQIVSAALGHARPDLRVESATCLAEAEATLSRLREGGTTLALAIVDYRLRGEDGLDLLLRVRDEHPEAPTLLLTGQASTEAAERARASGARVLWKPAPLGALLGEVELLLAS